MSYLPEDFQHQTQFPTAYGKDVHMQVRQITEQWQRFFPKLPYYCLESAAMADADAPAVVVAPIGEPGETQWDPLYGESIDPDIGASGEWAQPHGDGVTGNAVDVEIFSDPVILHGRVQREVRDYELKKYGFDKMRDIIVTFASSLLDAAGVTISVGDEFIWDGDRYIVLQYKSAGYWKNTNLRLFRSVNCEMVRDGS